MLLSLDATKLSELTLFILDVHLRVELRVYFYTKAFGLTIKFYGYGQT